MEYPDRNLFGKQTSCGGRRQRIGVWWMTSVPHPSCADCAYIPLRNEEIDDDALELDLHEVFGQTDLS
jgi:hypothetical protein